MCLISKFITSATPLDSAQRFISNLKPPSLQTVARMGWIFCARHLFLAVTWSLSTSSWSSSAQRLSLQSSWNLHRFPIPTDASYLACQKKARYCCAPGALVNTSLGSQTGQTNWVSSRLVLLVLVCKPLLQSFIQIIQTDGKLGSCIPFILHHLMLSLSESVKVTLFIFIPIHSFSKWRTSSGSHLQNGTAFNPLGKQQKQIFGSNSRTNQAINAN